MDDERLRRIRTAAFAGRLPEGLTQKDVEEYSENLVADYDGLANLHRPQEARRRLKYQWLALKRAEGAVPVDRARALIRQAADEGCSDDQPTARYVAYPLSLETVLVRRHLLRTPSARVTFTPGPCSRRRSA